MNARSAPERIGQNHFPDEVPDFTGYRWTAFTMAALLSPVESEALSMPRNHRLWVHNDQSGSPARPQPGKPNPQEPVSSAQTNAMAVVRALQDEELMAQGKDFGLQSCPSSQAGRLVEKQGDEKGKYGSDSLRIAALQLQLFQ
jgi:hypothetical protein